ncbi:hypothetical protein B0H13DRAFT_1916334 [Mycena leptocephala]|nr:hypothetical protein B0H13DRAFT_1916334 [Mycena leptocephala]
MKLGEEPGDAVPPFIIITNDGSTLESNVREDREGKVQYVYLGAGNRVEVYRQVRQRVRDEPKVLHLEQLLARVNGDVEEIQLRAMLSKCVQSSRGSERNGVEVIRNERLDELSRQQRLDKMQPSRNDIGRVLPPHVDKRKEFSVIDSPGWIMDALEGTWQGKVLQSQHVARLPHPVEMQLPQIELEVDKMLEFEIAPIIMSICHERCRASEVENVKGK